jgi:hypothetical protein
LLALSALCLLSAPAFAGACVAGNAADYLALNGTGGCTLGPMTFFNFGTPSFGNATPDNPEITPFTQGGEYGLTLNFGVTDPTKSSDVSWDFNVVGPGINDAFVEVLGQTGSTGIIQLDEQFLDSSTLAVIQNVNLSGQGNISQTFNFAADNSLFVTKDLANFPIGTLAQSSQLTDAFSAVPLPGAFPLFLTGIAGILWGARKKAIA